MKGRLPALSSIPRFPLAQLPTPLQEAPNLREALGGPGRCPRILMKRDDLTGLAFGGNRGMDESTGSRLFTVTPTLVGPVRAPGADG